jgi:hypothetical protein
MNGNDQEQEWEAFPPGALPQPVAAPGYGPPPGYGAQPGYAPAPGYGPPYPHAQYPQVRYPSAQDYGFPYPPTPWAPEPLAWPDGPARPASATTAAVLGFVTGGLTILTCLGFLLVVLVGEDDAPTRVLLLGALCAAGLITGGVRLLGRRSPVVLFGSALASVAVLLMALLVGVVTIDRTGGTEGLAIFVLMAAILPVLTAIFAWLPIVRGWAAARP